MTNKPTVLIFLCLLFACACSDRAAPERAEASESGSSDQSNNKPNDQSGGVYARPIDKARNVEAQVLEAAEKQKRDIEEQEGGG